MQRSPTTDGPPGCWGFFRDDAECDACPFNRRCRKSSALSRARATVADLAAESAATAVAPDLDPGALAAYAQSRYVRAGGKPFPRWSANRRFIDAMVIVIAACTRAHWDPRRYVRAQIEALTPNIDRGWAIHPGSFTGAKADERFSRWADRTRRRHGDARRDKTEHDAVEAQRAAAFAYARGRILGVGHRGATEAARQFVAEWTRKDMPAALRAPALAAALSAIDPVLPQMIQPTGEWTWKQAAMLGRHLREHLAGGRGPQGTVSDALGDFV